MVHNKNKGLCETIDLFGHLLQVTAEGAREEVYKSSGSSVLLDDMCQVVDTAHRLQLHAGHILQTPNATQHNVVLLQIVSDARNIGHHLLAGGETHQDALSIGRVGFLWLLDQCLEYDALGKGFPIQWLTRRPRLNVRTSAVHLIQRGHAPQCHVHVAAMQRCKYEIERKT